MQREKKRVGQKGRLEPKSPAGRHAELVLRLKGLLRPFGISAVLSRCAGSDLVLLGLLSLNRPGDAHEEQ